MVILKPAWPKLPFPLIGSRDFSLFGVRSLVPGVALASGLWALILESSLIPHSKCPCSQQVGFSAFFLTIGGYHTRGLFSYWSFSVALNQSCCESHQSVKVYCVTQHDPLQHALMLWEDALKILWASCRDERPFPSFHSEPRATQLFCSPIKERVHCRTLDWFLPPIVFYF